MLDVDMCGLGRWGTGRPVKDSRGEARSRCRGVETWAGVSSRVLQVLRNHAAHPQKSIVLIASQS
jgi:broad specificity phosphatase PhoE